MRIVMLGINHRTATLDLRERLSLQGPSLDGALDQLQSAFPKSEAVIVSTCNRTEIYVARPSHDPPTREQLIQFLARLGGLDDHALTGLCLHHENEEALIHLFRLCSGLESMVLGEPQVLGQVRRAYERAVVHRTVGGVLHKVFQQALAVGKQVRTCTGIDAGRVSIGSVAVDFARRIFESFEDKTVLAIGAGEMAKVALRHLQALQPARLWLTSRTWDHAQALAALLDMDSAHVEARPFESLDEMLVEADIVLSSTGSPQPILTHDRFIPLIKRRRARPLFLIDLALPRDIQAQVGHLSNVYLYNLDDLQQVVNQTQGQRGEKIDQCQAILLEEVQICLAQIQNRDIGQVIRALRVRLHELGQAETQRSARRLAASPANAQAILDEHTQRLINKILHLPLSRLDRRRGEGSLSFYAAALRKLFDLPEEPTVNPTPGNATPVNPLADPADANPIRHTPSDA